MWSPPTLASSLKVTSSRYRSPVGHMLGCVLETLVIVVIAVVVIALATALAPRVNIAGPLVLMAIGLGVSLLPFVPAWEADPEWILVGILPPLLYSAAVQLPAVEFRRDFGPIAGQLGRAAGMERGCQY